MKTRAMSIESNVIRMDQWFDFHNYLLSIEFWPKFTVKTLRTRIDLEEMGSAFHTGRRMLKGKRDASISAPC